MSHLSKATVLCGVCSVLAACDSSQPSGPTSPEADLAASGAAAGNTWHWRPPMLYGRAAAAAAAIGSTVYLVGGANASNSGTTTLQTYSVTTRSWSTRRPLPLARAWTNGASVINGVIYVS